MASVLTCKDFDMEKLSLVGSEIVYDGDVCYVQTPRMTFRRESEEAVRLFYYNEKKTSTLDDFYQLVLGISRKTEACPGIKFPETLNDPFGQVVHLTAETQVFNSKGDELTVADMFGERVVECTFILSPTVVENHKILWNVVQAMVHNRKPKKIRGLQIKD